MATPKGETMKCKDCKFLVRRGNEDWECTKGGFHMEELTYSCSVPDGFVPKEDTCPECGSNLEYIPRLDWGLIYCTKCPWSQRE